MNAHNGIEALGSLAQLMVPAYLRRDVVAVVSYNALLAIVFATMTTDPAPPIAMALFILGPTGALLGIALRGQGWPMRRRDRFALLLALAGLAAMAGHIVDLALTVLYQKPIIAPSVSDALRLIVYPVLFVTIFLLPRQTVASVARTRFILDSLMVLIALATACWFYITGPTFISSHDPIVVTLLITTFSFLDAVGLVSLVFIAIEARDPRLRPVYTWLGLALVILTVTDSVYDSRIFSRAYTPDSWLYLGWSRGLMIGALAARASRYLPPIERKATTVETPANVWPLWRTLLPYAVVPLIAALAFSDVVLPTPRSLVTDGVDVGFLFLLGIVLARQVLVEMENRRLYGDVVLNSARLSALSLTDALTDLPNQRALREMIELEVNRAERNARTMALLFCDLDYFKDVNDTRGHATGDAVLREFGAVIRRAVRGTDVVGRWGGEEFLIVLPEIDPGRAVALAERLRETIGGYEFLHRTLDLTCSIGVAVYPADATTPAALINAADRAMYLAKTSGRNQVRLASEPLATIE